MSINLDPALYARVKATKINASRICRHFLQRACEFVEQPRSKDDALSTLDEEIFELINPSKLNIQDEETDAIL